MLQFLKDKYLYIHNTFHGSEVILWSRINVALGTAWVALQGVDVSPLIKDPKWLVYYIIFSNLVNESLRRHRAEYEHDGSIK